MESLAGIDQLQVSQVLRVVTVDLHPRNPAVSVQSFLTAPDASESVLATTNTAFNQDILGDLSNAWHTFIQSGQVWALIIGIVLGYLIRNLTAY